MRTLEALQRRIGVAEDLRSIVRTMKSLSAVSIRQFEHAAASLAEYDRTVELALHALLRERRAPPGAEGPRVASGPTAAVVFGSDHGLCGRFNDQVVGFALRMLDALPVARADRLSLAVGVRAAARLTAAGEPPEDLLALPGSVAGLTATAERILIAVDAWRTSRGVTRVLLVHNRRTAGATASPHATRLLPLDLDRFRRLAERPWPSRSLPMYTLEPERLLAAVVREYFFVSVYRAAADSMASEHATRLAAMQAAERNIEDHLEDLQVEFRSRRQQAITEELLDIVAGFEALRPERQGSEGG